MDIRYNLTNNKKIKNLYDCDTFQSSLHSALSNREAGHEQACDNTKTVQTKPKKDYSNCYSNLSLTLNIGPKVIYSKSEA